MKAPKDQTARSKYWDEYNSLSAHEQTKKDVALYRSLSDKEKSDIRTVIKAGPDAGLLEEAEKQAQAEESWPEPDPKVEFRIIAQWQRKIESRSLSKDALAKQEAEYKAKDTKAQLTDDWAVYSKLSTDEKNDLRGMIRRSGDAPLLIGEKVKQTEAKEEKNDGPPAEFRVIARHRRAMQAPKDPEERKIYYKKYNSLNAEQQGIADLKLYNSLSENDKKDLRKFVQQTEDGKKWDAAGTIVDNFDDQTQQKIRIGAAVLRQKREEELMKLSEAERAKAKADEAAKKGKRGGKMDHDEFMKAQQGHWNEALATYEKLGTKEQKAWAKRLGLSDKGSVNVEENDEL
eukprot:TRINITY_DN67848_c3_g1_i1.p1 TRINITY_DN67848_c3_g1~~TRINITY_DN67848_c3_g1_i1.p1  ORF type:complete len:388 (-),score=56.60 TRINITY_DN67848_c3_g1_i1:153-1187(-)